VYILGLYSVMRIDTPQHPCR